jgi:hypothetical protein
MVERKLTYEIKRETLSKIFFELEKSITNNNITTSKSDDDIKNDDKIILKKVTFDKKNPYILNVKKIKRINETIQKK